MKLIDLTGQKFGRLTVVGRAENKGKRTMWVCKCDCGNEVTVRGSHLKERVTTSCGCYNKECVAKASIVHGYGNHNNRLYRTWCHMKERCFNNKCESYPDYGGRGITICDEWRNNFKAFCDWSLSHGYAYNLSIDRIDVNGDYEPNNCRWVTMKEQQNNRRNNRNVTFNGKTQTLKQWSEETGIKYGTLQARIDKYHWNIEKALTTK